MNQPIDFVLIWVDGADPAWQAEKNRYLPPEQQARIDASPVRYRDWDNLKYWFRAVETYAPWVNRVHFVTCGQLPEWLDPEAPKLHFVRHSDFIPERFLPTFSSHPIELNLHRIPGLSEQFVFCNDDQFLGAPTRPEDFFRGGLPCDFLTESPMQFSRRELYNYIRVNDTAFASRQFDRRATLRRLRKQRYSPRCLWEGLENRAMALLGKQAFFGFDIRHLPNVYLKRSFEAVWQADPAWLEETCSHRFRDHRDISQSAVRNFQLLSGDFRPYPWKSVSRGFSADQAEQVADAIRQRKYKLLCINDSALCDFDSAKRTVNRAWAETLPEKSSFEK